MNILPIATEPTEIVPLLEEIIEELARRLETYSSSPKANQYFIDQQNEILIGLYRVYDEISCIKYLSIWKDIELIMIELEQRDSEIPGHTILFRTRDRGQFPSLIDKYW
jgi:hypothetical protein